MECEKDPRLLTVDHGTGSVDAYNRNDGKTKNIPIIFQRVRQQATAKAVIFAVLDIVHFVHFCFDKKKVLLYVRSCKLLCNGKLPKLLLLLHTIHI